MLTKFNTALRIKQGNPTVGMICGAAYVASGFQIQGALLGDSQFGLLIDVCQALLFYCLGQLYLVVFFKAYSAFTAYDDLAAIEQDKRSVGVSLSLTLIAVGINASAATRNSSSIFLFIVWALIGTVVLLLMRKVTDTCVLTTTRKRTCSKMVLDDEIDQGNWGAAAIEGVMTICYALCLNTIVPHIRVHCFY